VAKWIDNRSGIAFPGRTALARHMRTAICHSRGAWEAGSSTRTKRPPEGGHSQCSSVGAQPLTLPV